MKLYMSTLNNGYKRRLGFIFTMIVIFIGACAIYSYNYYNRQVAVLVNEESRSTIKNVSSQNVIAINKEINSKFTLLKSIAGDITNDDQIQLDRVLNDLSAYSSAYNFYNMGIVLKDGTCHTTLHEELNLAGYDYVVKVLQIVD